jgi:hypothetical protein
MRGCGIPRVSATSDITKRPKEFRPGFTEWVREQASSSEIPSDHWGRELEARRELLDVLDQHILRFEVEPTSQDELLGMVWWWQYAADVVDWPRMMTIAEKLWSEFTDEYRRREEIKNEAILPFHKWAASELKAVYFAPHRTTYELLAHRVLDIPQGFESEAEVIEWALADLQSASNRPPKEQIASAAKQIWREYQQACGGGND